MQSSNPPLPPPPPPPHSTWRQNGGQSADRLAGGGGGGCNHPRAQRRIAAKRTSIGHAMASTEKWGKGGGKWAILRFKGGEGGGGGSGRVKPRGSLRPLVCQGSVLPRPLSLSLQSNGRPSSGHNHLYTLSLRPLMRWLWNGCELFIFQVTTLGVSHAVKNNHVRVVNSIVLSSHRRLIYLISHACVRIS